jgi:hypothetical protein
MDNKAEYLAGDSMLKLFAALQPDIPYDSSLGSSATPSDEVGTSSSGILHHPLSSTSSVQSGHDETVFKTKGIMTADQDTTDQARAGLVDTHITQESYKGKQPVRSIDTPIYPIPSDGSDSLPSRGLIQPRNSREHVASNEGGFVLKPTLQKPYRRSTTKVEAVIEGIINEPEGVNSVPISRLAGTQRGYCGRFKDHLKSRKKHSMKPTRKKHY